MSEATLAECGSCGARALVEQAGTLQEGVCAACGARWFGAAAASDLRERFLGVTAEAVRVLTAQHGAGITPCRACTTRMRRIPLRDELLEVCANCGAMMLRKGQLASLTAGAVPENEPADIPSSPTDLARLALGVPLAIMAAAVVTNVGFTLEAPLVALAAWLRLDGVVAGLLVRSVQALVGGLAPPVLLVAAVVVLPTVKPGTVRLMVPGAALLAAAQGLDALNRWGAWGLLQLGASAAGVMWVRSQAVPLAHAASKAAPLAAERLAGLTQRLARRAGAVLCAAVALSALVAVGWRVAEKVLSACPTGTRLTTAWTQGLEERACRDAQGARHGMTEMRTTTGTVVLRTLYRSGVESGEYVAFYADGVRKEQGQKHNGQKSGVWNEWHPNGSLAAQGAYTEDRKEGPWVTFHPNGRPASEAFLARGQPLGRTTRWSPEGTRL